MKLYLIILIIWSINICMQCCNFVVLIANATPFTNYTVRLVACTDGGCTESLDGANIQTLEDGLYFSNEIECDWWCILLVCWQVHWLCLYFVAAPTNLSAPVPDGIGTTYIVLRWTYPLCPNGILTGFILYKSSVPIYTGVLLSFNVTGLSVGRLCLV